MARASANVVCSSGLYLDETSRETYLSGFCCNDQNLVEHVLRGIGTGRHRELKYTSDPTGEFHQIRAFESTGGIDNLLSQISLDNSRLI